MLNIIVTIIVLGVIVLIHELGHFWAARSIGVSVLEFSIGMGPRISKYQGKSTVFSLRAIPLGGYCMFDPDTKKLDSTGRPASIQARPAWQKIMVSLSGPLMNFVLAILILTLLFSIVGVPAGYRAVVGEVEAGSPADQAGMQAGDLISAIQGQPVTDWQQMGDLLQEQKTNKEVSITVQRNGQSLDLKVMPQYDEAEERLLIGITVDTSQAIMTRYNLLQGLVMGVKQTFVLCAMMLSSIGQLISGQASVSENLSGPVGLIQIISDTAKSGVLNTIYLTAFLSINLGLLNLLPVPALDGGNIVIYLIELVRRKAMDQDKEGLIHLIGYILLLAMILILTYKDIMKLIGN
jgi:regulator of sigma E protease